jgi:lipopolysaccharide export system protein LptA
MTFEMTRLPYWAKIAGVFLLAGVGIPLAFEGIRAVVAFDPFASYFGNWASPFGRNIGSVMEGVDVAVYDGSRRVVSFRAARLEVRRDKQHMQLENLTDGTVYRGGKPAARFDAGLASYDAYSETVEILGGARIRSAEYDLRAEALTIDKARSVISVPKGLAGSFREGALSADSLRLDYSGGRSVATHVSWKGLVSVQGEGAKRRTIQIRSEKMEFTSKPDMEVHTNAEVSDGDAIMRSRKVTWDKEKDIVTLEGECEYYGPEAVMSAPRVVVYRKEKRVVSSGGVRFLVKPEREKGITSSLPPAQPVLPPGLSQPKPDDEVRGGKNARKYPVEVTCAHVEYFYAKDARRAVLSGAPKARQQMSAGAWRELNAPIAVYDEENDTLTLRGEPGTRDVKMTNSLGDKLSAETLVISTKEGNEKMTGTHIEGIMKVREEETGRGGGRR